MKEAMAKKIERIIKSASVFGKTRRRLRVRINKNQAFTLIEIMFVVIIIGILAALVAPRFVHKGKEARANAAKASMKGVAVAIDLYYLDVGAYPPNLQALVTKGSEVNWKGPYVESSQMFDPWGREFVYSQREDGYDLKSLGPDGTEGSDDISNK